MLDECTLCAHKCKVNRLNGQVGRCKSNDKIKMALASLHFYEEPCISGEMVLAQYFFLTAI